VYAAKQGVEPDTLDRGTFTNITEAGQYVWLEIYQANGGDVELADVRMPPIDAPVQTNIRWDEA
jgi:hypothetical protein